MYFVFLRNILQHSGVTNDDCALRELRWLPISERVVYKLCFLVHKASLGQSPDYVTNLFQPVTTIVSQSSLSSHKQTGKQRIESMEPAANCTEKNTIEICLFPKTENVSFQPYVLFQITRDNDYVMCPRS